MERPPLIALARASFLLACASIGFGCNSESDISKDEVGNFKNGMSAERRKEIGAAPKPPDGPMKPYSGGSANDKAQGR